MLEFYLITVLDNIRSNSDIFMIISSTAMTISFLFRIGIILEEGENDIADFVLKKISNISAIIFVAATIFSTLIPTKTEMLMILGVGGTVDYLKENDTAKQIPDKCLKLLDKWINEELEESEKQ